MTYKNIGFIGLGLIGGSLAKKIREIFPATNIYACAAHQKTIDFAQKTKVINSGSTNLKDLPQNLDLVFICTPIKDINKYIKLISAHTKTPLTITDVASVKEKICEGLKLKKCHIFIGGHPMAGKEKSGIEHSDANLITGTKYLLTKQKGQSYKDFKKFLIKLECIPLEITPQKHDFLMAFASHLPYLMASLTTLTASILKKSDLALFKAIISTGFFDTTRVASSPALWGKDISLYNKKNILNTINLAKKNLTVLEKTIKKGKEKDLENLFQTIKNFRDKL